MQMRHGSLLQYGHLRSISVTVNAYEIFFTNSAMQEAILLHQALSGGPSGPGTGISQGGSGFPHQNVAQTFPPPMRPGDPMQQNVAQTFPPPMRPGDPIPGMNFLGGTVPPLQNFEQRFEQGIGRQQQPFVNPPGGMFGVQGGPMNPPIGSSPGTFGINGQSFLDPTAGQFGPLGAGAGSPAIGFRPQMDRAIGFRPQMDGGHNHSSFIDNRDHNSIAQHDSNSGVGGGRVHSPLFSGSQGEQLTPESNLGSQVNTLDATPNLNLNAMPDGFVGLGDTNDVEGSSNIAVDAARSSGENVSLVESHLEHHVDSTIGISQIPVETPPIVKIVPHFHVKNEPVRAGLDSVNNNDSINQSSTVGRVTRIMEDSSGLHYFFYPRPQSAGLRVNITKSGFCQRKDITRENRFCMNSCYSDKQCPSDYKCCPVGCSLECSVPTRPGHDAESKTQTQAPSRSDSVPGK